MSIIIFSTVCVCDTCGETGAAVFLSSLYLAGVEFSSMKCMVGCE